MFLQNLMILLADNEGPDQTARMQSSLYCGKQAEQTRRPIWI